MRKLFYPILLSILLASCGGKTEKTVDNTNKPEPKEEQPKTEISTNSKTTDPLFLKCENNDSETGKSCGYYTANGEEIIPKGKYSICLTDTFTTMARVSHPEKGFVGINRQEEVLFTIFNNGVYADHPYEGMFRIVDGDNMGFADLQGNIIVSPKYSGLFSFDGGLSIFCEGCHKEYMGDDIEWVGGKWGALDKTGKEVIPARYDESFHFNPNGTAQVMLDGETFSIDTQGNEI